MPKTRTRAHWVVLLAQVSILSVLALRSWHLAAADDETDPPGRVARLSYLHGSVSFQPAGETEWVGAIGNRPLTTGDRLWTDGGDARAELTMGSATVRLGASTDFAFINLDDRIVQMQLTEGTVVVSVRRLHRDEVVEVDTPNQAFSILRPGSYRVEVGEDGTSTLVTVRAGEGEASGGGDSFTVHAGQSTRFTGADRLEATDVRLARLDALDEWAQARDRRAESSASARYVSPDVVGYEDLDDNGTWLADSSYGHVWMPTRMASGWAPYHDGHWAWISPWGYTWVDDAPWGYAPFHYGRWVTIQGRWGWVPGPAEVEAVYAPALVAFIGGPGFGLSVSIGGGGSRAEVGWFPLGPREVYVPGYHVSRAYVDRVNVSNTQVNTTTITNVYNTQTTNQYRVTNVTYVNRTAPGAVTVVPQQAFAGALPVARAAVKVNEQRLAAAPIGPSAAAVPTQERRLRNLQGRGRAATAGGSRWPHRGRQGTSAAAARAVREPAEGARGASGAAPRPSGARERPSAGCRSSPTAGEAGAPGQASSGAGRASAGSGEAGRAGGAAAGAEARGTGGAAAGSGEARGAGGAAAGAEAWGTGCAAARSGEAGQRGGAAAGAEACRAGGAAAGSGEAGQRGGAAAGAEACRAGGAAAGSGEAGQRGGAAAGAEAWGTGGPAARSGEAREPGDAAAGAKACRTAGAAGSGEAREPGDATAGAEARRTGGAAGSGEAREPGDAAAGAKACGACGAAAGHAAAGAGRRAPSGAEGCSARTAADRAAPCLGLAANEAGREREDGRTSCPCRGEAAALRSPLLQPARRPDP